MANYLLYTWSRGGTHGDGDDEAHFEDFEVVASVEEARRIVETEQRHTSTVVEVNDSHLTIVARWERDYPYEWKWKEVHEVLV